MVRHLVGSRIRERRERLGWKQVALAARVGISPSYLNLIEHNRRGIGGARLIAIAEALGLDLRELSDGANVTLTHDLTAAIPADDTEAEADQIDEFVSRFPGFAALVARQKHELDARERSIEALSDRLAHDPYLGEALHEMVSSITAIQATSGILTSAEAIEPLQTRRFQNNIHEESNRLTDLAAGLSTYFDRISDESPARTTPVEEVEGYFAASGFRFPDLEHAGPQELAALIADAPELVSDAARHIAGDILSALAADARALPQAAFLDAAAEVDFDPIALARRFDALPDRVFRRLAFLPAGAEAPKVGLFVIDSTGAVLLSRRLAEFALPRHGAGCGLWPIYRVLSRPHTTDAVVLQTEEGDLFHAHAFARYHPTGNAAVPEIVRATMLIRPISGDTVPTPPVRSGASCRICLRSGCGARREPSLLRPPRGRLA